MRMKLIVMAVALVGTGQSQTSAPNLFPVVKTLPIQPEVVTLVHLSPGYAASVRLPEAVSSVMVGDPSRFKAEHSESEPDLVFLKPLTSAAAESNALITTRTGEEISLHLVSVPGDTHIDFLLDYRRLRALLVEASQNTGFLVAETLPVETVLPLAISTEKQPDLLDQVLSKEKSLEPHWQGKELVGATGETVQSGEETILAFSVINRSETVMELLPPQIELSGRATGRKSRQIKAEPVPVAEYRLTERRLLPHGRADGVVRFERPAFKESSEHLQLVIAQAAQVDRPILLPVPFTAQIEGGAQ